MPDLKLIYYPNEILERECETVTSVTDEIILFAEEMANLMYKNGGVGLAANQVGDNRRLILVDAMYSHTKKFDLIFFQWTRIPVTIARKKNKATKPEI